MLLPALLLSLVWFGSARPIAQGSNTTVLILGGGVSGVIAARTLHRRGIRDFVIIEGRHELGGRMQSHELQGGWTIEAGANWIQGTAGSNPIHELAMKHRIRSQPNDFDKSFSTYDSNGEVDYHDIVVRAADEYTRLTDVGVRRFNEDLVDLNSRAGYALIGAKPMSKYEAVAEYFQFDLEFAQTPEQTSWVAQSMNDNFTYETTFADDADLLAIDPRGFKALIQSEANEFLQPSQAMLNTRVVAIDYSDNGVSVRLDNGQILNSQYALCTFSLGVLQSDDITFSPVLP